MFPSHPQPLQHFKLQTFVVCSMNSGYALTRATSNLPNPPKLKPAIRPLNLSRFQFCCVCARGWHQWTKNNPEHPSFLLFHGKTHARSCKIMHLCKTCASNVVKQHKAIIKPFFSTSRTKFIVLLAALSMSGGCFQ